MWTLALETTSRHPSLALLRGEECVHTAPLEVRACAASLVTSMQELLARQSLTLPELSLLVVANGPGSFTGVRIGLATVKALMEAAALPAITVGTLDAVRAAAGEPQPALAALDAGRGEIHYAIYPRQKMASHPEASEGVEAAAAFSRRLEGMAGLAVTPDASLAAAWPQLRALDPCLAPAAGQIGVRTWLAQGRIGAEVLSMDARYLGGRWER